MKWKIGETVGHLWVQTKCNVPSSFPCPYGPRLKNPLFCGVQVSSRGTVKPFWLFLGTLLFFKQRKWRVEVTYGPTQKNFLVYFARKIEWKMKSVGVPEALVVDNFL